MPSTLLRAKPERSPQGERAQRRLGEFLYSAMLRESYISDPL